MLISQQDVTIEGLKESFNTILEKREDMFCAVPTIVFEYVMERLGIETLDRENGLETVVNLLFDHGEFRNIMPNGSRAGQAKLEPQVWLRLNRIYEGREKRRDFHILSLRAIQTIPEMFPTETALAFWTDCAEFVFPAQREAGRAIVLKSIQEKPVLFTIMNMCRLKWVLLALALESKKFQNTRQRRFRLKEFKPKLSLLQKTIENTGSPTAEACIEKLATLGGVIIGVKYRDLPGEEATGPMETQPEVVDTEKRDEPTKRKSKYTIAGFSGNL